MHIQLLHTSASLTINENWDPDVRDDMEMMLNRWKTKMGGRARDLLTKLCFLRLLSRPDKLCAATSNRGGFQRQAPLFGMLALIFLCKRGRGKVMQCMELVFSPVCVPFPLLHCTSQTAGSQVCRAVAVVPTTAQTLFSATFARKLLLRLVPEQIPFKHSCEGPDDMPAHAKVVIFHIFYIFHAPFSPPGLPSWFQPHPSHLRRSSDSRHLAGADPPHP